MGTKKITITLDDEVLYMLATITDESGYSRSEQIEGMIRAEFAEIDRRKKARKK